MKAGPKKTDRKSGDATQWPVLRRYSAGSARTIACPIGGIGTGTISLGGRGNLRDFEVMNRPAKGYVPQAQGVRPFLCIRTSTARGGPSLRILEGPLLAEDLPEPGANSNVFLPGMPRFEHSEFLAAYPLLQVDLKDSDFPIGAKIQAWNPLIPAEPDLSGLPFVVIRLHLKNRTREMIDASVAFTIPNFIGNDGRGGPVPPPADAAPANPETTAQGLRYRIRLRKSGSTTALVHEADGPAASDTLGTFALALLDTENVEPSHRTAWRDLFWGGGIEDFLSDILQDGGLDPRTADKSGPTAGSLCARIKIRAGEERALTWMLAWHFPHRIGWSRMPGESEPSTVVGNHYATRFRDAWDVVRRCAPKLADLERRTVAFVGAVTRSSAPEALKECALSTLVPLRSQTSFRCADGHFHGWEGCGDHQGNFAGSCTHVWHYDAALPRLFGRLARSMRETEFLLCTREDGLMHMRSPLPRNAPAWIAAAADGQCGAVLKLLRDYRMHGDINWLRRLWPKVRAAMEFCWIPGGWDADQDGVMEGPQHNTMDVEYCGPNPQVASWYLAALNAAAVLAHHAGDRDFSDRCQRLAQDGRAYFTRMAFNGDYFEQRIVPVPGNRRIPPGLSNLVPDGNRLEAPDFQLGAGCSIDQLAAWPFCEEAGLDCPLDRGPAIRALRAVLRHNRRGSLRTHLNPRRPIACCDEPGVLLATWPRGGRPARPFPYWSEIWSGCEYLFAAALIWAGLDGDGVSVVRDARSRHAGHNRNPFNEREAGSHYARTLSGWAPFTAWSGHAWDAVSGTFRIGDRLGNFPWFTGDAWGTWHRGRSRLRITIVEGNELRIRNVVCGKGSFKVRQGNLLKMNRPIELRIA